MRRAAKRDSSEPDIIDALRKCGWSVLQVSVKDGPDLFASKRVDVLKVIPNRGWTFEYRTVAIECKTGKKKLRPGQVSFRETWQGEYVVCRTVQDVLDLTANDAKEASMKNYTS